METKGGGTGKVLKMLPGIVGNQLAIMFITMVVWLLGQEKYYTQVKRLLLVDVLFCIGKKLRNLEAGDGSFKQAQFCFIPKGKHECLQEY